MFPKYSSILFAACCVLNFVSAQEPQFRSDYTFSAAWRGFYKFHRYPLTWRDALARCRAEDALLATPHTSEQVQLFQSIMKEHGVGVVYTGIHDNFSKGDHATVEGIPLSRLSLNWTENEPDNIDNSENCLVILEEDGGLADENCNLTVPFICYKKHEPTMNSTLNYGYEYSADTGSRYKFHRNPRTWSEAYRICVGEGGHLAIINTPQEARILKELFARNPESSMVQGNYWKNIVLVGFSEILERDHWETLEGVPLELSGYSAWESQQPDHATPDSHCGSMHRSGRYNDIRCDHPFTFICERDAAQ